MHHRTFTIQTVLLIIFATGCSTQPQPSTPGHYNTAWAVKANYTDTCSCLPSCPCLFGSPSTLGYCEGITLIEIEQGHYNDITLDGVKVLAIYKGGDWIKFHVTDKANSTQTQAAVKLLPAFEKFFAIKNVLEVKNVPLTVKRSADRLTINTPDTKATIEIMKGANGKPIKIANLPAPGFPAPPLHDHTQYRSISLKHQSPGQQFDYSKTNGFTANIHVVGPKR